MYYTAGKGEGDSRSLARQVITPSTLERHYADVAARCVLRGAAGVEQMYCRGSGHT